MTRDNPPSGKTESNVWTALAIIGNVRDEAQDCLDDPTTDRDDALRYIVEQSRRAIDSLRSVSPGEPTP